MLTQMSAEIKTPAPENSSLRLNEVFEIAPRTPPPDTDSYPTRPGSSGCVAQVYHRLRALFLVSNLD